MCFNAEVIDNAAERDVLTIAEVERMARNFPGLHHLNLSGGEPFLREDFPEIPALFYRHSGARFFTVATNSSRTVETEAAVERICRECPDAWVRINQSLDGVGEVHDRIRGKEGLFERVVELNERLSRLSSRLPNLSVAVITVLSNFNRDAIGDVMDYAYRNLDFTDYGVLYVRGETRDPEARRVESGAYHEVQRECARRARERAPRRGPAGRLYTAVHRTASDLLTEVIVEDRFVTPCRAGRNMVVMDDEGMVEPCEILSGFIREGRAALETSRLGNIREFDYDIRKLLSTDHARRVAEYIVDSRCYCTYECAMATNVLYTPRLWARAVRNAARTGG
jgi:MoaA/NifB/PqqE/SkfB family radical SAM enzyme